MPPRLFARADLIAALLLAALFTAAWSARDWGLLSRLRLPDTDDGVRLQQIRDWLAGQSFTDLAQHRLGAAPGVVMHWSRLADLVPGALITALAPVLGRHGAEVAAVILWPALLFAGALLLAGSIARRLGAPGTTAVLIAALAYPASSLFLPGRIDHHGLQLLLLLAAVRATLAGPRGAAALGATAALGLVVGMEMAPLLALGVLIFWGRWVAGAAASGRALLALAGALGLTLLAAAPLFGGSGWLYPACDGFTRALFLLAEAGAGGLALLALAGQRVRGVRARLALSAGTAAVIALLLRPALAACLHPYGTVDPLLQRLWLADVMEAQPLLQAAPATALSFAGLMIAGVAAGLWQAARQGGGWRLLLGFQLLALAIACWQLRGAAAGTLLAPPALAGLVAAARARGTGALALAWIGSAGISYPLLAGVIAGPASGPGAGAACTSPAVINRLAELPPGTLIAPIDAGAYALAATRHRLLAAPYHRNNAGNAAVLRFFASSPAAARAIAARWHADYLLYCPGALGRLEAPEGAPPGALVRRLRRGARPGWIVPLKAPPGVLLARIAPPPAP